MTGQPLRNIRGSLRQGCPGSMGWFAIAIDPLLIYLEKRLSGIPICSLPALGPLGQHDSVPLRVEERYKVYGLADDVKPGVSSLEEFSLVDTKICGLVGMAVSTTIFAMLPLIFVKKLRNNNDSTSRSRSLFIFSPPSCNSVLIIKTSSYSLPVS